MVREIKFRAWVDGKMIEWCPWFFSDSSEVTRHSDYFPEDDDEVILMQYTGLKDKNGREIFEGDVLAYSHGTFGFVEYRDDSFVITWIHNPFGLNEWLRVHYEHGITVIGNIYENPDLLQNVDRSDNLPPESNEK